MKFNFKLSFILYFFFFLHTVYAINKSIIQLNICCLIWTDTVYCTYSTYLDLTNNMHLQTRDKWMRKITLTVKMCSSDKGFRTFLYSSSVMVPSLSVSCMLNRTGRTWTHLLASLMCEEMSVIEIKDDRLSLTDQRRLWLQDYVCEDAEKRVKERSLSF